MLVDWIYGHPSWMSGTFAVFGAVVLASAGVVATTLLVPRHVRSAHNEVAGYTLAIVGVIYAVLLAFIAVVTWETFSKAGDIVNDEASHLANLYSDVSVLQGPQVDALRDRLAHYVRIVITQEWPAQQGGRNSDHSYDNGWHELRHANQALLEFKPGDRGEADVHLTALKELNALFAARRVRIDAATDHVPELVWWTLVLGGVLTVAYTFLFGMPNTTMHLLMTGGIAASVALVIVLIVEFDYPFRGEIAVSKQPFIDAQQQMTLR